MQVEPEIAFRDVPATEEYKNLILEGIDKLENVYPHLISCRTVVTDTTPDRRTGNVHRVRVEVAIPGSTIVVDPTDSAPGESRNVAQAISHAFDLARRRLQKAKELQAGDVKTRGLPPHGRVTRLLTDDFGVRYGFLHSREGRQVYFHEEALVGLDYDDLEVGDEVRFAAAEGDEGLQASTVAPLDPGDVGPRQERSIPLV
ncbi:MAG: HPF/RaiA family ribosome-associated protein [Gemmatimonadales bacterium]|nr:MAG: HPF/RaiA family ribosome-associated protein [Gemmatimonadales bacterium]